MTQQYKEKVTIKLREILNREPTEKEVLNSENDTQLRLLILEDPNL